MDERSNTNTGILPGATPAGPDSAEAPLALTGRKAETALALYHSRTVPVSEICKTLGRTSLYRLIQSRSVGNGRA